jgi:hypothetical protein
MRFMFLDNYGDYYCGCLGFSDVSWEAVLLINACKLAPANQICMSIFWHDEWSHVLGHVGCKLTLCICN